MNHLLQLLRYGAGRQQGKSLDFTAWGGPGNVSCAHSELRVMLDILEGVLQEESLLSVLPMPSHRVKTVERCTRAPAAEKVAETLLAEAGRLEEQIGSNRARLYETIMPLVQAGFRIRDRNDSLWVDYDVTQLLVDRVGMPGREEEAAATAMMTVDEGATRPLPWATGSSLAVRGQDFDDDGEGAYWAQLLVNGHLLQVPFAGQNRVEAFALRRQQYLLSIRIFQALKREALEHAKVIIRETEPFQYCLELAPGGGQASASISLQFWDPSSPPGPDDGEEGGGGGGGASSGAGSAAASTPTGPDLTQRLLAAFLWRRPLLEALFPSIISPDSVRNE